MNPLRRWSVLRRFCTVLTLLVSGWMLAPPLLANEGELFTEVSLLIGRPGDGTDTQGSLVVPGTVIPVWSDDRLNTALSSGAGEEEARLLVRHTRLKQVALNLKKNLRLGQVEIRYQMQHTLPIGEVRELPPPTGTSDVRLQIQLLGFNDETATYSVQFFEGSKPITDTPLTAHRGKQAVVGGVDGDDAPFLFLVIAPDGEASREPSPRPLRINEDIQPPLAIAKTTPPYTDEARQQKVEGVVVVRTVVETDGTVADIEVLHGLPHGLTESTVETIRQWRFEPALKDGQPVAVYYDLSVNFRLDRDDPQGRR